MYNPIKNSYMSDQSKLDRCSISTKFKKKKISIKVLIKIHEMKVIMLCALVVMKEVRKNCTTFKEV